MSAYVCVEVTDAAAMWPIGGPPAQPLGTTRRTVWCRLPGDWVTSGRLDPARRTQVLDALCGPAWRAPHDRQFVLEVSDRVLTADEVAQRPWTGPAWGAYVWTTVGFVEVTPAKL